MYREFQAIIHQECPYIFLWSGEQEESLATALIMHMDLPDQDIMALWKPNL